MTRRNLQFALIAAVIGGFVFVAMQRLATVPVYGTDEAYTLQVPYEILNHGKLALPMYRYLGGNIENVWHSLTPLFFLILSGFLKVFGFGVLQGRVFNLITVVLTLWMVYLIGRRLFEWRVGLVAVLMITSDQTVLERSRQVRNDYAAEALALLAFYLYEAAARRKSGKLYVASGLAAGAGVMCHTTILYMLGAIFILMLLQDGWRLFTSKKAYQFAGSALAVMSYEIVYDLIDYKNFLAQYRGDEHHFGVLTLQGWWANLLDEPTRYVNWYTAYDVTFQNIPRTLLHTFQILSAVGVVYLIVRGVRHIKRGDGLREPRVRLLVVTAVMLLFFANVAHKSGYYNAHLVTWFGLCVGVMVVDSLTLVERLRTTHPRTRLIYRTAFAVAILISVAFVVLLARQHVRYIREVRNPELASFQEFQNVLRDIVPSDVCPVAVKSPPIWLAFLEKDRCFANIERRMTPNVDIDGKDFALFVRPKSPEFWGRDLDQDPGLLGELTGTPYGNFLVYYTGNNPRYLESQPKRYYFFRRWRGHVNDQQISQAREVLSADAAELGRISSITDSVLRSEGLVIRPGQLVEVCPIDLKRNAVYQAKIGLSSPSDCEVVLIDPETGHWITNIEVSGRPEPQSVEEVFRTFGSNRVVLGIRFAGLRPVDSVYLSSLSIREVASL
jgi:4-amino-4-deoxy-L-arabinose transferase-like glycosyltransferase